jgi:triacylglycerol esterase/lipase EstA (alpha/beta hydrolase family)
MDSRIGPLADPTRQARVIVVAQSMGGLVAGLGGALDRQALITLGTPHRGSPKALDWLSTGRGSARCD